MLRNLLIAGLALAAPLLVIGALYLIGFGKLEQSWPLAEPGATLDTALDLEGGAEVQFTVHASYIDNDTCERMRIHLEMQTAGRISYKGELVGFDWDDDDGGVSSAGRTTTVGTIHVNEEGVERLTARYWLEPEGCAVEIDDLELQLRRPRW